MKNNPSNYKYNRVLLVDDMELDNFVNKKFLLHHQFSKSIYVNTSAKGALEFLNNLIAAGIWSKNFPEVIFIDVNMPVTNGYQFIESLQELFKMHEIEQPKLVVLTSSVFNIDRQRAMDLSEDIVFMTKPLSKEMLDLL
jgi:CheY-like chemotaxis protein